MIDPEKKEFNPTEKPEGYLGLPLRDAEAAARACMVRYGKTQLRLSWLFEVLLRPFLFLRSEKPLRLDEEPERILVLEYWNLGDLVMLTPFLKNLRLHYPKAHIAIIASPRAVSMLEGQGLVDEIVPVKMPWAQHMARRKKYFSRYWGEYIRCIARLRARRFDLGFTVRADIRDNFLLWVGKVRHRVGYGYGYGGSLLTEVVPPDLSQPHYADRWLHLLEHLGKPVLDRQPELRVGPEQRAFGRRFLGEMGLDNGDVLVGFHPGARNEVRQWGNEKFLEVARRLTELFPVKILWFQDPGAPEKPSGRGFIPVTLPLKEFMAVLSECKLLVCNDTGPMHMASGLGVPVVAVFGPGMREWWGPRSAGSQVVAHESIWCRPCFDYCIFDQPYCLRAVTVDSVYEAAAGALNGLVHRVCQDKDEPASSERLGMRSGPETLNASN
jgi:lipopolysaccharide heptosyltransferase II